MKNFILSCLSLIMVAACTTNPANELLDSENQESVNLQSGGEVSETLPPGKARVRFEFEGLTFGRIPMTRGADPVGLVEAGVNYLYIYEGETLLLKQTAGEAGGGGVFGSPSLVLDYGSHTLTFVASDFELDDTDNQVRSGNAFGAGKTVTVDANTTTQSVVMARIKTGLRIVINDNPANLARLSKVTLLLSVPYAAILPGSQLATERHSNTLIISCDMPQTTPVAFTLYTFCPSFTEVFDQSVTVLMKDKDTNSILCNRMLTVPLLMNRITEVRGIWLTTEALVTVDTGWGEELVVNN